MHPAGAKRTVHVLWSSRAAFVWAGAGAVVGFSNFWQFPSLVFAHGGGAFLIVYLGCLLLFGAPLLAAELMIGRLGRDAPDGAFSRAAKLAGAERAWWTVGAAAILAGFLIFSYLSVVAGWTAAFGLRAASGALAGLTADGMSSHFAELVTDTEKQMFWYTLFIGSIALVCARGVRAGLEPCIRYAAPMMFVLMLLLLLYAGVAGDMGRAALEALMPDFTKLTGAALLAAAGHAFFSIGLGAGAMFMYGAYLDDEAPLPRLTWYVLGLDTLAGVAAALTLYALLYASGVDATDGPALLFHAIPLTFDQLPFGRLCATIFFVMLIMAAWLSGLALFEPAVMWLVQRLHWSRGRAALTCAVVAWMLALVSALSFSRWAFSFQFLNQTKRFGLFDVIQIVTHYALLPAVGVAAALFAGWALTPELTRNQMRFRSPCAFDTWLWLIRIAVPVTLVIVTLQQLKF